MTVGGVLLDLWHTSPARVQTNGSPRAPVCVDFTWAHVLAWLCSCISMLYGSHEVHVGGTNCPCQNNDDDGKELVEKSWKRC